MTEVRDIARMYGLTEIGACRYDVQRRPLLSCRAAARLPDEAKTVIVCAFPYAFEDARRRNLSRYACVPDYHKAAGAVLGALAADLAGRFSDERFEPFMDNSPLPEVACAVAAGLGVRGDHGLLIHPRFGSFVFLGCIVTTMALPASEEYGECRHCGACAAACPGGCLPGEERATCASALTQQKQAWTPEEEAIVRRAASVWGCDRCQEVCPMNREAHCAPHPCFTWYEPWLDKVEALEDKAYGWRPATVIERNLRLFSEIEG